MTNIHQIDEQEEYDSEEEDIPPPVSDNDEELDTGDNDEVGV